MAVYTLCVLGIWLGLHGAKKLCLGVCGSLRVPAHMVAMAGEAAQESFALCVFADMHPILMY